MSRVELHQHELAEPRSGLQRCQPFHHDAEVENAGAAVDRGWCIVEGLKSEGSQDGDGAVSEGLLGVGAPSHDEIERRRVLAAVREAVVGKTGTAVTLARYVLLECLGRGGGGTVYAAYDPELDRKVAIKLVGSVRDGEHEAQLRILHEAQALARLSHPNVVAVHDVGTYELDDFPDDGFDRLPVPAQSRGTFLVMDLLTGQNVRSWLQAGARSWRQIVDVFVAAGEGLAAAHDIGLVHRDVKPDNIVVGDDGRVRVVDFGLATQPAAEVDGARPPEPSPPSSLVASELTGEAAVVGTVPYMAPEVHDGKAATRSSDQYSMCVALFEALYGELPFQGKRLDALWQDKRHERFRRPLSSRGVPLAVHRVVLRGLAARPQARFPDVRALLLALRRARDRRRRLVRATGALATLGAVAALAQGGRFDPCPAPDGALEAAWGGARRLAVHDAIVASDAPYASATADVVLARLDEWAAEHRGAHVEACAATRVDGRQSESDMHRQLLCLEEQLEEFDALTGVLASPTLANPRDVVRAVAELPRAEACALAEPAGAQSGGERDEVRIGLRRALARGRVLLRTGAFDEGILSMRTVIEDADENGVSKLGVEGRYLLGALLGRSGAAKPAIDVLRQAYFRATALGVDGVAADAAIQLVFVQGYEHAQHDEGLVWAEHAEAAIERARGPTVRWTRLHNAVGLIHQARGDLDRAEERFRRAIALAEQDADETPLLAVVSNNLALLHFNRADYRESVALGERVLGMRRRVLGPGHPDVAESLNNLGIALLELDDLEGAMALLEESLAISRPALGPDHARVAGTTNNLGNVLLERARFDEATRRFEEALRIYVATFGDDHPDVAMAHMNLGRAAAGAGRLDDAARHHATALEIRERVLGPEHTAVGASLTYLGLVELDRGHETRALELLERALANRRAAPVDDPHHSLTLLALKRALDVTEGDAQRRRALAEEVEHRCVASPERCADPELDAARRHGP